MVTLHADITSRRQGLVDVQREFNEVEQHMNKRDRYIEAHQVDTDRWDVVDHIDVRLLERVDRYLYRTPHQYLSNAIGSPVLNRTELDQWRVDAVKIERYRLDHNITGPETFELDRIGNPARPPYELQFEVNYGRPSRPAIEPPSRPTIEPPEVGLEL